MAVYLSALSFARHGVPIPPALLGKAAVWLHSSKGNRDAIVMLLTGESVQNARLLATGHPDGDQVAERAMDRLYDPDRGTSPGLQVLDHARLLGQMIAAVPPLYQVAPRTLLALVAYWSGDGALADRHCEEALRIDRACTLASQIRALQALGVPPGWVERATTQ